MGKTHISVIQPQQTWRVLLIIPPKQDCLKLFVTMQMPNHIQDHSRLVCRVSLLLTDGLIAAGIPLNRKLVQASAMLHDITKPRSFSTGENHAQTGGEYLAAMGCPEVGSIIRQHVVLDHYFAADYPDEAEVVNYADKRVLHDRIVSLDDRMQYILQRYAKTPERQQLLQQVWEKTRTLEQRLFAYLAFTPELLAERLT